MPSDNPHTPQSPSQNSFSATDLPQKPVTSPRNTHSLPTPAHSINGSMSSLGSGSTFEGVSIEETSNKRKRDVEDSGDRDLKKVHVEDGRLRIEDLHIDVGKKYLLCKTPHSESRADVSLDLFERYNLTSLAKSVARRDANNPNGVTIRKSYKSVFKKLSGNFDVEKKELGAPDTLFSIMLAPAEEWDAQFRGNELDKGLSEVTHSGMGKALSMVKGPIPKTSWNSAVLGEVAAAVAAPPKPMGKPVSSTVKPTQPALANTVQGAKEIPRPKRNVKKRAYGDSSYEGYGEGYVDDDLQEAGYSTGDGEDRGSRKRPKKTAATHQNFQQGPMRQNSYGPGMVGA